MNAQAAHQATAAIRQLHEWMARLPMDSRLWQVRIQLPDVADRILQSACDPDSTLLLAPEIYIGIVRGCGGSDYDLTLVRALYALASTLQTQGRRRLPPEAPPEPSRAPSEIFRSATAASDDLSEMPTVPRIPRTTAAQAPLPPDLREITTQAGFVCYLRQLVSRSGYVLRQIEQKTEALFPDAIMRKSTLHDALKRTTVPTDESALRSMLTVLYMRVLDRGSTDTAVLRHVDDALAVWRHVQNPAAAEAGLVPEAASHPLIDTILATLHHAEEDALLTGDGDASGLARAQRIVRELAF